ncbi:uncharacterized protein LOC110271940 [Arachis ipaensis]|uniref:uncharacterized protein LOC110271940 n=1 Tax=Arachis ipaensis TaxID=130454 RepID=UPI000A2B00AD|nr:uncharacterized protein LOC110271940 [Arachis ipaensis]
MAAVMTPTCSLLPDEGVKAITLTIIANLYQNNGPEGFYGYDGTGKTFLWNSLSASIRAKGQIVLNVVSSSIVALLLPNGRTAHSRFKVSLSVNQYLISLDKCLRDVLRFNHGFKPDALFDGKVVFLGGDSCQPVIPHGSREDVIYACVNSSYLWHSCHVLQLRENMRHCGGTLNLCNRKLQKFAKLLLQLSDNLLLIISHMHCKIWTKLQVKRLDDYVIECVILTCRNISHVVFIPIMNIVPNNKTLPIRFTRRQFPVVLCFAMTINKLQG